MKSLRSRFVVGRWARRSVALAVPVVLVVAVTVTAVWLLRIDAGIATDEVGSSDLVAFCTGAVAIHNRAADPYTPGFPEYGPLVQLAEETLSPGDALRIRAAVKTAEGTHPDYLTYETIAVGEELTRLCPDHEVYSVVAVP